MNDYFVFSTHIFNTKGGLNQAKLVTPNHLTDGWFYYGPPGQELRLKSALQFEPYPPGLNLTFQVPSSTSLPDNYATSNSFSLFSRRLVELFTQFQIEGEAIPATLIDKSNQPLTGIQYYLYHLLGLPQDVMDETASGWTGDRNIGLPRLVIDPAKSQRRPVLTINQAFCKIMRKDIKEAIESAHITGFDFYLPSSFKSGKFGTVLA